jgi:hypothetical protein
MIAENREIDGPGGADCRMDRWRGPMPACDVQSASQAGDDRWTFAFLIRVLSRRAS